MARNRKKRGTGGQSLPPARRKQKPAVSTSGHDRAHSRAVRYWRQTPAVARLTRTGDGWVLEPHGGQPIVFLAHITRFRWPTQAEIALAGRQARYAGRQLLEVDANSDAERKLIAGRTTTTRAKDVTTASRPPEGLTRARALLRSIGVRTLPTQTRLIVLDNVDCHVGHNKEGHTVVTIGASGPITFSPLWTSLGLPSESEVATGIAAGATREGDSLRVAANSPLERELVEARFAVLAEAKRLAELEAERARAAEEAERERQASLNRQLLQKTLDELANHANVTLDGDAIYYAGVKAGTSSVSDTAAAITVCGQRLVLSQERAARGRILRLLETRLQQLRALQGDLRRIGAEADIDSEGLRVNGHPVAGLSEVDPPARDLIVGRYANEEFERHISKQLGQVTRIPIELVARDTHGEITLRVADAAIGTITSTTASVDETVIDGNFLEPHHSTWRRHSGGAIWSKLGEAIAARSAEIEEARRAQEARAALRAQQAQQAKERRAIQGQNVVHAPPPELPRSLVTDCLVASKNIRLNRTAAFNNPVTLITDEFELTFNPIDGTVSYLTTRFHYEAADDTVVEGLLRLSGGSDPLPVTFFGAPDRELAGRVWATVLLGFAALTVVPDFVEPPRSSRRHGPPRRRAVPSFSAPRNVNRTRGARGHGTLTATGWTATAHWVAGHVRVLAEGMYASASAEHEAGKVGIRLRPGETWVRPHVRGGTPGRALLFRWDAPSVLDIRGSRPRSRAGSR